LCGLLSDARMGIEGAIDIDRAGASDLTAARLCF
jgi:hypothetical protein